ncbi:MAG: NUDIX domain-containing protein, partial [Actinomycetes bacterium]
MSTPHHRRSRGRSGGSAAAASHPPDDAPALTDTPVRHPVRSTSERYRGPKWSVRTDTVDLPAGTVDRDVLAHPGSVGIIALDAHDRVLLVHQYRHPVSATLWEPPAGLLDKPGENPLVAAQRELYEEAHQRAADWHVLLDAYTTPGCSDEATRLYLARGLTAVPADEQHEGEHEEAGMPVAWVPLDDVVEGVLDGRLHNPLLVMGVLAVRAARASGADGFAALRPADAPWPDRPTSPG